MIISIIVFIVSILLIFAIYKVIEFNYYYPFNYDFLKILDKKKIITLVGINSSKDIEIKIERIRGFNRWPDHDEWGDNSYITLLYKDKKGKDYSIVEVYNNGWIFKDSEMKLYIKRSIEKFTRDYLRVPNDSDNQHIQ